ncbi:hypothetical protein [Sulfurimonas sp.]|uniref:hypothetical protein n=1 Tax=Sulfurimonas sp. TaxID=2022749 RepID=UPI0025F8254C|nr:hypothetical protein [Sulfurimonas sp.]MDD5157306.1 hypothetical protein [Sulfurimonas sp.]
MKLTKLSLVAVALLTTSTVFAIENTKVSGDARLYYGTTDSNAAGNGGFFSKDASYTDISLHLGLTTDLTKGISAGVGMQVVTTLGVENNLVSNVWSGAHGVSDSAGSHFAGGKQVDSAMWMDEVWLAGSAFDTTLKVGRQTLDTPLAFTETWGLDKNTFEAVVLVNQSIKDTTLVATFIGKSNGSADEEAGTLGNASPTPTYIGTYGVGSYVAGNGRFNTFGTNGVYAIGAINNSFKPVTVQAWYYDMVFLAKAYWLQADVKCSLIDNVLLGVQFANTKAEAAPSADTTAYSLMAGYVIKDVATIKAAFSSVDSGGALGVANTATGTSWTKGGQSKLYTEMWWNYGNVSAQGATSYSLTAEGEVGPKIQLLGGIYYSDIDNNAPTTTDRKVTEATIVASKAFGPLETSAALIFADKNYVNNASDVKSTDIQLYLKYNF